MTQLENALNAAMLRFNGFKSEGRADPFKSASALYYLIHEGRKNGFTNRVKTRVIQHLRNVILGGREPCIDCQHFWHYVPLTASILLAKKTPEIWDQFGEEEIEKIDTLMECFVYVSNFIANDVNEYRTGLSLHGNVYKEWNPNFKLSLVTPMVFAAIYFGGADKIDEMLLGYSYDAFIEKLKRFGFTNMLEVWAAPAFEHNGIMLPTAKELTENGGTAYIRDAGNVYKGGDGFGVRTPFLYKGLRADDMEIIDLLISDCYGGGLVFSHTEDNGDGTYDAYILDETSSPVDGKYGLMTEFNCGDKEGLRSDARYCEIDFIMVVTLLSAIKELLLWSEDNYLYPLVKIGNADLIYKLEHGYVSRSLGRQYTVKADNLLGYEFLKDIWERYFGE